MQKIIEKDKGNFIIGYCDNSQDISIFNRGFAEAIRIEFQPKIKLDEIECLKYTSVYISEIVDEAKKIIEENMQFYKYFDIFFNSKFTGILLYKDHFNRLIVSNSRMDVKCEIKEELL